jgi:MFS transporter, MHS family, proline/betaine transporter
MINNLSKRSFFGAALGTMIEYYDYALFITFLPILAPIFFPTDSLYQSLIKGYWVLLIAMIARPLGGIFFGYLGDVLGRRKALLASMYGIAFATICIGITPNYATLGIATIIIITMAKAVQLFCFGGEYNGAGIYVVEHAQNKNEGFASSLLTATTLAGSLLASVFGIIVTSELMPTWSWRVAFIFGGLIGIVGIIYRKNLLETPYFKQANLQYHGLLNMMKQYPKQLLAGFFIGAFATVPFTTVLAFINPVLMTKGYFNNHQLMWIQTLFILIAIITLIFAGIIADKKSAKKIMQYSGLALAIFSYPLLWIIDKGNLVTILIALSAFIIINELFLGPSNAYLKNLFAMQYRYRASSFSFCLGMSLLGGLTPIVENYLYQYFHHFSGISLWLVFIGLGSAVTLTMNNKKYEE